MRINISLPLALMLLTASFAAADSLKIKGAFQGYEIDVVQPPILAVNGHGTGIATQLGVFTVAWQDTVSLADGSATGSYTLTAPNGDTISATTTGQGDPETPGLNSIVEINTVTGGTGQFSGAKGSFTVERLQDPATGFTSGALHGTIIFSARAR